MVKQHWQLSTLITMYSPIPGIFHGSQWTLISPNSLLHCNTTTFSTGFKFNSQLSTKNTKKFEVRNTGNKHYDST